ncbi:MAG: hypothetical protein KBB70_01170 [Candidatus Pacebacteria bacterium]|nr:hypothetical protein [Candidatus Paceibacterota bacterium]
MTGMSNKFVKGFFGTALLLSGLLSFTQIAKAQTNPWITGSIEVENTSLNPASNGLRVVTTVKVSPPAIDSDRNGTIENTSDELNAWDWIIGGAGTKTGNNYINNQAFFIDISADQDFDTVLIHHPLDVTANNLRSVQSVNIAPPTDTALNPSTAYFIRIIGLAEGSLGTRVLYTQTFTTQAPGNDLTSTTNGAGTSGNQNVGNGLNTTADEIDPNTGLPECGIISSAKFFGCVGQFMYYVVFVPTSWVMVLAGEIMDFGIGYSISSSSYPVTGHSFVTDGWRIMRDLANIFFIFILIYVAISTILGQDKKKLIGWVILVALIINFSLFLTKVVVDFGNITSRFFYNNISISNPQTATTITGSAGHKSISYGFASTFNPAKLLANAKQSTTINSAGGVIATGMSDEQFAGFYTIFALVGGVVNLVAAFVFFSMAWLFIARTIGIWLSMIFAPLAFLSLTLPDKWNLAGAAGGGAGKYMKFGSWWSNLTSLAVMPAIAMLMIFLILTFLKSNFLGNIPNETTTGQFIGVLLPLIMVSYLLLQTKKTAESMAGDFGGMMSKAGNFVGGAALGLATGGTALLARKTIGAGAAKIAESRWAKNAASKSWAGEKLLKGTRSIGSSSFDARNVKIAGKDLGGVTGFKVGKSDSKGYIKDKEDYEKERSKKKRDFANSLEATAEEKTKMKQLENEAKRKEYYANRAEVDPYTGKIPTPAEAKAAKDKATAEKARLESVYKKGREQYAQRVENGTTLGDMAYKKTKDFVDKNFRKNKEDLEAELSTAEQELNELKKSRVNLRDANNKEIPNSASMKDSNGNIVTQEMIDKAQGKVTDLSYKISRKETGQVGTYANETAEAIRSGTKDKKKAKDGDFQSVVDANEERTKEQMKESEERIKEMMETMMGNQSGGGKQGGGNQGGGGSSGGGGGNQGGGNQGGNQSGNQSGNNQGGGNNPGYYTGTNVGFKPQPKAQAQQSNQPTANAPIGFRPQANANFTGGNYGKNSATQQQPNQYSNLGGVDDNRKINSTAPINISNSKININTTGGVAANSNNSQGNYSRSQAGFNRQNNQPENRPIGFQFGGNAANEKAKVASSIGKEAPLANPTAPEQTASTQTTAERKPIGGFFGNREAAQTTNKFEQKTFERRPLQTNQQPSAAPRPAPAASSAPTPPVANKAPTPPPTK